MRKQILNVFFHDILQQAQEDASSGDENMLDFSVLFEMDSLQKALLNVKSVKGGRERERERNLFTYSEHMLHMCDDTSIHSSLNVRIC